MRPSLPIDEQIPAVIAALRERPSLVVKAPPGAGKTTRLPAALLDHGLAPAPQEVLVLEPRRIAARMAALRVAAERGGRVGGEVGYRVRFEQAASRATRLCFLTEGVLVRRLQRDPELRGAAAVVFDEFHERGLEADLALALLREVQATIRPDLRLVVMSATLDPGPIAAYLGGCPVVASEGRAHPLAIEHAARRTDERVELRAAAALARLLDEGLKGSALVFVPGAAEIRRTVAAMAPLAARRGLDLLPLHGDLPPDAQQAAVQAGLRPRVIVATNVAEASITVEGIEAVIDSGLARVSRYDPHRGLNRLHTERISRSAATQRAGRAGRLGPGRVVRLYTAGDFAALAEDDEPEVGRVDLSEALLQIIAWGTPDPRIFPWLTPPRPVAIERGLRLLRDLGAIAGSPERLTAIGREMLAFPLHPRPGRLLVEARRLGCFAEATLLAALLGERDLRSGARAFGAGAGQPRAEVRASSDLLLLAELWDHARRLRFEPAALAALGIDGRVARRCGRVAEQLCRTLPGGCARGRGAEQSVEAPRWRAAERSVEAPRGRTDQRTPTPLPWLGPLEQRLLRAVAAAYPDRLVRSRAPGSREGLMVGGMGTRLDPASAVAGEAYYVALDAVPERDARGRYVLVRLASGVRPEWLADLHPHMMRATDEVRFDEHAERVVGRRVTYFQDLPLEEKETGAPDPELAAEALCAAAARNPAQAIEMTRDLEDLIARIRWLAERRPDLELPAAPDQERVDPLLLAALRPLCRGLRSFGELRRAPLLDAVRNSLSWETRRLLDAQAPARLLLPSGRSARVEYRPGEPPWLAARLQEFFGCRETPRVGGGQVPVVLHLLAPNQRPVQVTADLASFWRTVYPEIRHELGRRYPKHAWPEDPLTAKPEARPRRRG